MSGESINRRKIPVQQTKNKIVQKQNDIQKLTLNSEADNSKKRLYIFILLLIIITFGVFSPTFKNTYTNWDDGKYVSENPLIKPLDGHTINEMFFSKELFKRYWMGNYHPLSMLTLNINYSIAQKDADGNASPFGFQLLNILLHVLNTLLVFFIIHKLLKNSNIAFGVALLFGIHTLHVESVTWIAERKDVLYTFFYLLSLYFYIFYSQTIKLKYYFLALILFIFSSLSKGQATSLALTIILIDYFFERKLLSSRVIIEKIPFLIIAFIFGLIAIEAQKQGNALQVINNIPLFNRIGVAAFGFTMYLLKLILPLGLSAIYPYPDIIHQTIPAYFWLGLIPVLAVLFLALKSFKKDKILFVGIAFFLVNIVLLLQLIPVGSAIYSDRYVYIPSIGFYLVLVYLMSKVFKKNIKIAYFVFGIYAVLLSVLTINRIGDWKDSRTLWEDVSAKQPKAVVAWNNLGSEYNRIADKYFDDKDYDNYKIYKQKAIKCFDIAIDQKPDYSSAFYNRAFSKFGLGKNLNDTNMVVSSIEDFNRSIATDLTFVNSYEQRASVYEWLGDFDRALSDYNYALTLTPNNPETITNRGIVKGKSNDYIGALEDFNKAIELNPQMAQAYSNRGLDYAFMQNYEAALKDYNKSIDLDPAANTYFNRGMSYYSLQKFQEAINDFQTAINLKYDVSGVFYYKALCEKKLNLKEQACVDMQTAAKMNNPVAIKLLDDFCK